MSKAFSTAREIESLKATKKQYEIYDKICKGLSIRVSRGGEKSFSMVYTFRGRRNRITFGRFPAIGLSEARNRAYAVRADISRGNDPNPNRRRATQEVRDTRIEVLFQHYLDNVPRAGTRYHKELTRILLRQCAPALSNIRPTEIEKADIAALLRTLRSKSGPSASINAFAALRQSFNWLVNDGCLERSPCDGLTSPAKKGSRSRVLRDDELAAVVASANKIGFPFGTIVLLLAMTGQRRSEVAMMKWEDLDLVQLEWRQPAHSNKSNREHLVHLSEPAARILKALPRFNSPYVFCARGALARPVSGYSKWKAELDRLCGVGNWTLHDLRRTAATYLARKKHAIHVIEFVLNHSSRSLGGVAGIYNQHQYMDERREAITDLGGFVSVLLKNEPTQDI